MVKTNTALQRTRRQLVLQEQVEGEYLSDAIPFVVKSLFRFTHRASDSKALWSDAHVVWLGRNTFATWCIEDAAFDVPWIVKKAKNAPKDQLVLQETVREEVMAFFQTQLSALPRKKTGNWLPLP